MKKKPVVLLVEDNPLASKIAVILLEQLDCQVDTVATGYDAIERTNERPYNLIFMDLGLPDIDGLSAIETIKRSDGLNSETPIVALTAHSDQGYINQAYDAGVCNFLVKPLSDKIGREILQEHVGEI